MLRVLKQPLDPNHQTTGPIFFFQVSFPLLRSITVIKNTPSLPAVLEHNKLPIIETAMVRVVRVMQNAQSISAGDLLLSVALSKLMLDSQLVVAMRRVTICNTLATTSLLCHLFHGLMLSVLGKGYLSHND